MEQQSQEEYSHVMKYTGIFGGVQGLVILIGLVRNKSMALLLGVAGMGFNALLVSIQNFASQCTNLGISFGAVPRLSELYEHSDEQKLDYYIRLVRMWSIIAAQLGLCFCVAVSPLLNSMTFTWGDHTLHYAFLGIAVAISAIAGGELAILKATRRLGAIAKTQVYSAICGVVITVPIYYLWRHSGVAPAIVLMAAVNMLFTIFYSYRSFPFTLRFERRMLSDGVGMLRLGVAFVLATAVGSGAEMLIRSFLNVEGDMNAVGIYNSAYMITITYAGMVFTAMETDFFPRLSAVGTDVAKANDTVNKQMEVSLLMLSPMLVALLTTLPILVPLLFSREFLPVVGMAQIAVLSMYFKVITMPVAYITLARRDSLAYFFLESAYFVVLVAAIIVGYKWWDILGTGVAIVVAHIFDFLMINTFAYFKYDYRSTSMIARYAGLQLSIGLMAFAASLFLEGWLYWIAEAALTIVSTAYSLFILRQKTHLWDSLKRKFRI